MHASQSLKSINGLLRMLIHLLRIANCRLTQPMGIDFDKEAPAVVLPEGLMCPFNSQNTLFDQKALWGTLIPITTSFRVCDIWRGYWVQVSAC